MRSRVAAMIVALKSFARFARPFLGLIVATRQSGAVLAGLAYDAGLSALFA
ncbi:MAG: hypothetical protein KDK08_01395 [Rhizobiaceae bacterium]|nr:hypothetical protein [Rhizobiaceae bacterium]